MSPRRYKLLRLLPDHLPGLFHMMLLNIGLCDHHPKGVFPIQLGMGDVDLPAPVDSMEQLLVEGIEPFF